MMNEDEYLARQIAALRTATRDPEREAKVRRRCHAALARQTRQQREAGKAARGGLFELAAAAVLSVYLAAVLKEVVRIGGWQ